MNFKKWFEMNDCDVNFFIDRTVMHMRRVQDNMILLEKNRDKLPFKIKQFQLLRRGMHHDLSKFSDSFAEGYIYLTKYYFNRDSNIKNDNIDINSLRPIREMHHIKERHHPHNKKAMSNLDLCEMCCDLAAMAWEKNEINFTNYYLNIQEKKFPLLKKYNKKIIFLLKFLEKLNNYSQKPKE